MLFKGSFIIPNVYNEKKDESQSNILNLHHKNLEEDQNERWKSKEEA